MVFGDAEILTGSFVHICALVSRLEDSKYESVNLRDTSMSEPFEFLPHERQAGERLLKLQCKWRVNVLFGGINPQGEIVRIHFSHVSKSTRRDLQALVDLQALQEIQVSGPFDCDGLLAVAAQLPWLNRLTLEDGDAGELTDQGVAHLAGHPSLKHLHLLRSSLTDAALHSLSSVRSLEYLQIWGERFTNAGAKAVAQLVNLKSLELQSSTIDDDGLAELASLRQLFLLSDLSRRCHSRRHRQQSGL
jgi:hypothetical protein